MPKKKTPELDPKEQFKRFEEAAKKAEVDANKAQQAFGRLTNKPTTESRAKP